MPGEKSVVITGASTGIGRACALHMDRKGWRVFAGVRDRADAQSLRREASPRLKPISLDVTDADSVRRARAEVELGIGSSGLDGLVNNAGIAYGGPVEVLDPAELRHTFDVNFFGLIAVTQVFIPLLRAAAGRIVNMSSVSGMVASPFLSPYTASKWAVEALSDAMRVELHSSGIKVSVVRPGAIDTPIWAKGKAKASRILEQTPRELVRLYGPVVDTLMSGLRPHGLSAEHVAGVVEQALTASHPRTRYHVGRQLWIVDLFRRLPDEARDSIFRARLKGRS